MKKIKINVHDRIRGKHIIESEYTREETINVFENMAWLLKKEVKDVKFKKLKKFNLKEYIKGRK